jgi:hypothetical protein
MNVPEQRLAQGVLASERTAYSPKCLEREILRSWARKEVAGVILRGIPTPNQRSAMDDKEGQIDELGEARDAQYALECVLVRLTEAELQRVIDDLPQRVREYIRVTTAHKIRHLGE